MLPKPMTVISENIYILIYVLKREKVKMNLEFDHYRLREARSDDAEELMKITNDKETMKYYGTSGTFYKTKEEALQEIDWFRKLFNQHGGRWVITEKNSDKYIGDIGFFNYQEEHNRVELGYKLSREFWGKGIITKCINLLTQWGFSKRNYNRIEALVDTRNEGSKLVLLKNSFRLEGILREYEIEYGKPVDLEMYSILRKDTNN